MAWQFPQSVTSTDLPVVQLIDVGESVFVAREVFIAFDGTGYSTITAVATDHQVVIAGTVANASNTAIEIGLYSEYDHGSVVTVEETGQVRGFEASAIRINGFDMELVNHGLIKSAGIAIVMNGQAATGASSLVNTGIIDGTKVAISHGGSGITTETLTVLNSGTISGGEKAYDSLSSVIAKDEITNTGKMIGDAYLGGGDDLYDGRLGTIDGDVFGDIGNDRLYAGAGNNRLFGQDGGDTLMGGAGADYLSGGTGTDRAAYSSATKAVIVSLSNPAINSGDAKGDSYNSIENLTGSNYNDALNGNSAANAINGAAGNDTIKGYAGNDTLTGYSGADNFVFNTALNASTNVDTIIDFNFSADTIQLDDAIFAALTAGVLASTAFRANTTGLAGDSSDRIIYETDTGELYYDANGNASGGGVLFAKVGIGLGMTNADFVVI
jgi:Ca2+-binding RTX toxin-like protein